MGGLGRMEGQAQARNGLESLQPKQAQPNIGFRALELES